MAGALLGNGFLNSAHPLNAAALDGVSCSSLCRQIQNVGLGQPATFTGNYVIDTSTTARRIGSSSAAHLDATACSNRADRWPMDASPATTPTRMQLASSPITM